MNNQSSAAAIIPMRADRKKTRICDPWEVASLIKTLASLPWLTVEQSAGDARAYFTETGEECFHAIERAADQSWIINHFN